MTVPRVIVIGPPRSGKSTFARSLRAEGVPTRCGDPRSLVKDPEHGVEYLPEGLDWSEGSRYVADIWLPSPGPWCCEGISMVRALRKVIEDGRRRVLDGCRIVVFEDFHPDAELKRGHVGMRSAIAGIWGQIAHELAGAVEYPQRQF